MVSKPREILLVGSVPLKPATAVFEALGRHHFAPLMKRVPDGEQAGWDTPIFSLPRHEAFEISRRTKMTLRPSTFFADLEIPFVKLREGVKVEDVVIDGLGVADNAKRSYEEFRVAKAKQQVAEDARFCVTMAGPLTMFAAADLQKSDLLALAERALIAEIAQVVASIPSDELTIQLDLAVEAEAEEYRRRPEAWELPAFEGREWTIEESSQSVANIVDTIPAQVEVGFHLCALYHIDESQGQDLSVHVDLTNALVEKIQRQIGYIHLPTVPTHSEEDFQALTDLRLKSDTKLFLGLIHTELGTEGTKRLVDAAAKAYPEFGVAAFCGLNQPSRREYENPHTLDEVLDMHMHAANCGC
jgi:methionine synthase II (cobalamin-independent)